VARALLKVANIIMPGRGLPQGPYVTEQEIKTMAEVASEEDEIEEEEKDLIHSIFEFGDTIVREVMVPRPDIVAIEDEKSLSDVMDLVLEHGFSRVPVFHEDLDQIVGIIYAKDVLKAMHQNGEETKVTDLVRPARFVPESKKCAELLREMQRKKFHIALVTDEYGSISGSVTLEDLLEELVGEITDEYDRDEPLMVPVGEGRFRVDGRLPIDELNEALDVELPQEEWDSVGGLMMGLLGAIPSEGQEVSYDNLRFKAERVQGRRIARVLVSRTGETKTQPSQAAAE
jgi:CBS domain containing-hemolysin-like protein